MYKGKPISYADLQAACSRFEHYSYTKPVRFGKKVGKKKTSHQCFKKQVSVAFGK